MIEIGFSPTETLFLSVSLSRVALFCTNCIVVITEYLSSNSRCCQ